MVGHFGDRVLGQKDLLSEGVLLFSGSCVVVCFSKGNSSGISKNESKEEKQVHGEINRYCSPQKDLQPFS